MCGGWRLSIFVAAVRVVSILAGFFFCFFGSGVLLTVLDVFQFSVSVG